MRDKNISSYYFFSELNTKCMHNKTFVKDS